MGASPFEEIDHTADWAIRVTGADLADLLQNAALGMLELAGAVASDGGGKQVSIEIQSLDPESLLVDFLEELLFRLETDEVTYRQIEIIECGSDRLKARAIEVPLRALSKQIKAVTYSGLKIEDTAQGLVATVVFDV